MNRPARSALIVLALLLIAAGGILFFTPEKREPAAQERPRIAATIYPLYDLARSVAGEHAAAMLIVPPGASPHTFEITPRSLEELQGVSTIFAIGHGLDAYALRVAESIPGSAIVTVDHGITIRESVEEDHGPTDPHYWLHFGNARIIVDTIARELSERDPDNRVAYLHNAKVLNAQLVLDEQELKTAVGAASLRPLVVFHDAWFYFAEHFGLSIVGAFEPSAAEEPTPRHLAELRTLVKADGVRAFFLEPQLSSATIESFVDELNLRIGTLDPIGGVPGRLTYRELMRYNVNEIIRAHTND